MTNYMMYCILYHTVSSTFFLALLLLHMASLSLHSSINTAIKSVHLVEHSMMDFPWCPLSLSVSVCYQ